MIKEMRLELVYEYVGTIERDLTYIGEDMEEIAAAIDRDENELLEYMQTGEKKGKNAFCFCGFMFLKEGIIAAKISEPFFG